MSRPIYKFSNQSNMGYKYCSLIEGSVTIDVGAHDWENHNLIIHNGDGASILITPKQAAALIKVLPVAIER